MKKENTFFKKLVAVVGKKATKVLGIVVAILLVLLAVRIFLYNDTPTVDVNTMYTTLTKASELTTAKLNFEGFCTYEDTGVPILNRSDFFMTFSATARVGIDLNGVKIEPNHEQKVILLRVPSATVQGVTVDKESIKLFNEKFALFNTNEKEDMIEAEKQAEKKAEEQVATFGVLEYADQQAESLLTGLLGTALPDGYEFRVERIDV